MQGRNSIAWPGRRWLDHSCRSDALAGGAAFPALDLASYLKPGDNVIAADITRPSTLPGEFVWLGKSYLLNETCTRLELPAGR